MSLLGHQFAIIESESGSIYIPVYTGYISINAYISIINLLISFKNDYLVREEEILCSEANYV